MSVPVEAVQGLEEVVGRWLERELAPLRARLEVLAGRLDDERNDRGFADDQLRDSIAGLERELGALR